MPAPTEPDWYWWRPLDRAVFFTQVDIGWRPVLLIEGWTLAPDGGLSKHLSFSISGTGTDYRVGHPEGEAKWEWGPRIPEPPEGSTADTHTLIWRDKREVADVLAAFRVKDDGQYKWHYADEAERKMPEAHVDDKATPCLVIVGSAQMARDLAKPRKENNP